MKRIRVNPLRVVIVALTLLGLFGTTTSVKSTTRSANPATQIVDFDGDGKTDVTLFDSTLARWFIYDFYTGALNQFDIGLPDGNQVVGDYDGDGLSDFALCYDNFKTGLKTWRISYSTYGPKGFILWGSQGDIPVPADYDGDGKTDVAVYRPFGSVWSIRLSGSKMPRVEQLGSALDKLAPADYDGDGLVDIAVMRPEANEWLIHFSSDNSLQTIPWDVKSHAGDVMVPADYDGDGRADFAVYRSSGGLWIIQESSTGNYRTAQFGNGIYTGDPSQAVVSRTNFDMPMPGDFDGDGIMDIAVWNSKSLIVNVLPSSSSIMSSVPIGTSASQPVSLSVVSQFQELNFLID